MSCSQSYRGGGEAVRANNYHSQKILIIAIPTVPTGCGGGGEGNEAAKVWIMGPLTWALTAVEIELQSNRDELLWGIGVGPGSTYGREESFSLTRMQEANQGPVPVLL